jgi:hypothetical protein
MENGFIATHTKPKAFYAYSLHFLPKIKHHNLNSKVFESTFLASHPTFFIKPKHIQVAKKFGR